MLRERYYNPQRRLEVVNINIKGCVFFIPKCVITLTRNKVNKFLLPLKIYLRKPKLEHGTIFLGQNQILFPGALFRRMPIRQIHLENRHLT